MKGICKYKGQNNEFTLNKVYLIEDCDDIEYPPLFKVLDDQNNIVRFSGAGLDIYFKVFLDKK